jgi:hypothetical protein
MFRIEPNQFSSCHDQKKFIGLLFEADDGIRLQMPSLLTTLQLSAHVNRL